MKLANQSKAKKMKHSENSQNITVPFQIFQTYCNDQPPFLEHCTLTANSLKTGP
uniref:Uncharacterized protein n=1 Tax=Anguilla anguilla TaxID=7936 RepID=A0A0E9V8W8_ANGAN